ncbi:MAG: hypothetical protein AB1750_21315 [Chloroflexota bacterium]
MKKLSVALTFVLLIALAVACVPSEGDVTDAVSTVAGQITYVPVTWTPDVNTIVAQTFAAMTAQAGGGSPVTDTPVPPTSGAPGSISGHTSYPSEFIPALRVVAFNIFDQSYRYVETQYGQTTYQITGLAPGKYHVVAYTMDGALAGGYTQMVPCGLSVNCTDHSLIDVPVYAGQDTPNIDPADWYADIASFPPMPGQPAPQPTITSDGPAPLTGNGGLAGKIQYPAGGIPAMRIVAFRVGNLNEYYSITTQVGQSSYEMSLPPGQYYVVAYTIEGGGFPGGLAGGYTQAVLCGLTANCTDHSLVAVQVSSQAVLVGDANIADWYAPPGTFPPNPYQ